MIYTVIASIILFYSIYMLLTIGIGLFYKVPNLKIKDSDHTLLVFFPMYKPGKEVVENLIKQMAELEGLNAKLFVLSQESDDLINSKLIQIADYFKTGKFSHLSGNSYHYALEFAVNEIKEFDKNFDSVLLLDPDNFIDNNSIQRLISSRELDSDVALSQRKSYSKNTSTSLFDGLSERLNDYMFRRSKSLLGFHPELSGSGMLMDTKLFLEAVLKLDKKSPGMDKQLLIRMMLSNSNLKISYDEGAVVLDEKTEVSDAFNRQRLRWFGNQYYCAYKFGWKLLSSAKSSLVDYGISLWRPPRSFQIVGSILLLPFDLIAYSYDWIQFPLISISALLSVNAIGFFLLNEGMLKQVISRLLPLIFTSLRNGVTAVSGSFNSNGSFIHTRINK